MRELPRLLVNGLSSAAIGLLCLAPLRADAHARAVPADTGRVELPVRRIPGLASAAEFYFSPDGRSIIGNAKQPGDDGYHVYTIDIDGTGLRRINDRGADACSFFSADGERLIWTSTRDHLDLPAGDFSDPNNYPQGAELYSSRRDGSDVRRLTNNTQYDAEVTVSPDGEWLLFSRQVDGRLDLWRMRPDGSKPQQITHTGDWQEGGALYLPDNHTILYRAWQRADQGVKSPMPMSLFTIRDDGTGLRRLTSDSGTNWAPHPAPDGRHYVFVKVLPPRNFEVFLGDLQSDSLVRLTYHDGFDGFPAVSPDGQWLLFTSARDAAPDTRSLGEYLMDISSLNVGPMPRR